MPVIPARETGGVVHALLHHSPLTALAHNKRMEVKLEAIGNGCVINLGREAAGARQSISVKTMLISDIAQLLRSSAGMAATSAANMYPELMRTRIETAF